MKREPVTRIRLLSIFILVFALLLIGKLYMLQIVSGGELASRADHQYVQSNYDYYDRGSIFFTTKDGSLVSAATLKSGFIMAINPKLITDPQGAIDKLTKILDIDPNDFLDKASKKTDPYEEIARKIPLDLGDAINSLKIQGLNLYKERWRYYPGGKMAAQTLGFVAYNNEEKLGGQYGLERYYDDYLNRDNDTVYVNFFAEIFSNIQNSLSKNKHLEGDVVTSIEPSVELFLEQKLAEVQSQYKSEQTGGIVMDPVTGEIFALSTVPTFDPNNFQAEGNPSVFSNDLVERVHEMGSIIKPLTMAAGLDAGVVTPETTYYDAGHVTLNGRTISNYDGRGRGTVPMQEVLNQSLNTGATFVMQQLGKDRFAQYMLNYGLGSETGIDLPNETHGLVDNLKSPRDLEYATASFGQGVAYTPVETIRALASLANGGKLVNPHIATKINYKIGGYKTIDSGVQKQILKPETSETITKMLVTVVDKALLGGTVKLDHFSIAAKTGTAQIADLKNGGYYNDRYLHSFFGYFPAFNPRFIVFLYTIHPQGVKYASETLTLPFMDIAKFLINYYQVPPDR